jgi:ActR/RegA family two-component response regulator
MTDTKLLDGCSVLVLDDDYFLADDTRAALEDAGATVVGPFGSTDDALASLDEGSPEYAILDLNLGSGPDFEIARAMKARGVPTVLVSGYDATIIPPDLAGTPRLQKPITRAGLIRAVTELVG